MRKFLLIFSLILSCSFCGFAGKPVITTFRDIYFTGGVPLDRSVTKDNADLKFQFGCALHPLSFSDKWDLFFGYNQKSVWNFWGESQPFKDNSYMPGIYLEGELNSCNSILTGLEHCSNGRPYFGNKLAEEGYDDYSRGMNYAFFTWNRQWGNHNLTLRAKAGIGCGVGDYQDHEKVFSQDLFLFYHGYLTAGYCYDNGVIGADIYVTPILNKSVANVTADFSWCFAERFPRLYVQFHYGFDECMCDCVKGAAPPVNIRFGLCYTMKPLYKIQ